VHTWLPLAHNQAPTAGSVILAGTLLKLGTYGIFRLALPMAPEGGAALAVVASVLCTVAVVYAALICWVQTDAKKLVAYSSVSHLGICMLGLFALNPVGAQGSVLYMINHGLSTGALFLLIGMAYERYHVKDMDRIGGLARRMPVWAFFMVFFTMSSIGLPGLNGFVGEYLCLFGTYIATGDATTGYPGLLGPGFALVAGTGLILGAMYMLLLVGRYVFGPLREPKDDAHGHHGTGGAHDHGQHGGDHGGGHGDLTGREVGLLVPLALVCLVIGVYPKPMLDAIGPVVEKTLAPYPAAVERALKAQAAPAEPAEAAQTESKEDTRG
jgi:NADH-quinone oxidoreductase subunit M